MALEDCPKGLVPGIVYEAATVQLSDCMYLGPEQWQIKHAGWLKAPPLIQLLIAFGALQRFVVMPRSLSLSFVFKMRFRSPGI
jgi:hypothetical protein